MSFINQQVLSAVKVGGGGGGGGGVGAPALPTLTSSGQTQFFRLYANTPNGHLYQNNNLTTPAVANLDPVLAVKDISATGFNLTDTVAGHGGFISTAAINGKIAIDFNGSTLLEADNATNVNLLRTATNIALFAVLKAEDATGSPRLAVGSTKSKPADYDSFELRFAGSGSHIFGGRWGANGSGDSTMNAIASSSLQGSWSDFSNKVIKIVVRAAYGSGAIQRLAIAASDGSLTGSATTTYTNTTNENDSAALAWDYFVLGGYYASGVVQPSFGGWWAEAVMWTGTSQMNDTDVTALMTYGVGTAGF